MKLNHNCIRDVLLQLEKMLVCSQEHACFCFNTVTIDELYESFSGEYSKEDIFYVVYNLTQAEYIESHFSTANSFIIGCSISNITYSGHEFLSNIRDDSVWKNTKNVVSKFSSVSLNIISTVAGQVIAAMIKNQLNI